MLIYEQPPYLEVVSLLVSADCFINAIKLKFEFLNISILLSIGAVRLGLSIAESGGG